MRFASFYTSANTANTLSPFAKEGGEHFFDQPEYDSNQQVAEEERPFAGQDLESGVEEEQESPGVASMQQQNGAGNNAEASPEEMQPAVTEEAPVNEEESTNPFAETFNSGPASEGLGTTAGSDANGPMPFAENFNAENTPEAALPATQQAATTENAVALTKNQAPAGLNNKGVEALAQDEGSVSSLLPAGAPQAALGGEALTSQEEGGGGTAQATEETGASGETDTTATPGAAGTASDSQEATATAPSAEGGSAASAENADQPTAAGTAAAVSDAPAASTDSDAMSRISAGRDVDFKPRIQAQAAIINADSDLTEISIIQQASERRTRVTELFATSRQTITDAIEGNALAVQASIISQQTSILTMAANAIASVQGLIAMATASAQALVLNYQQAINAIITNATQTVQEGISSVASEITGLINSVNLPDLPGVELARSFITGLISNGAGMVNNALSGVLGFISTIFNMGIAMMTAFIGIFGQMISQAFTFVSNALMNVLQMVLSMLNSVMDLVVNTLLNLLHGTLLPIIGRIERSVIQHIDESEQEHLKQVRNNRDQHLDMLANVLDPEAAGGGAGSGGGPGAAGGGASPDPGWTIEKVGQSAIDNNKKLVENFLQVLDRIFGNIIVDITTAVMRIVAEVSSRVNQFIDSLINVMMRLVELIFALVNAVVEFIAMLLAELIRVLSGLLDFIVNAISSPVTTTVNAARNILNRIRSAITSIISNFLNQIGLGSGPSISSPTLSPGPGGVAPAFAGGPILIIGGKIIIIIGTAFIILSKTTVIIILVLLVILLLILLYLLYRWLTAPKPAPPPPPPPPPPPSGKEYSPGTPLKATNSIPLTKIDIQVSKGEKMIFGFWGEDKDQVRPIGTPAWTDITGPGPYEVDWEISGDADLFSAGSGIKGFTDPSKSSPNLDVFVDAAWTGNPLKMTATFRDNALPAVPPDIGTTKDAADVVVEWTMKPRTNPCPTSLKRVAGAGATWVSAPARYTYKGEPQLPPPGTPSYENQTILETLHLPTALNFTMDDLKPDWKAANPTINTPDKVAAFLWPTSNNGTFVFNSQDLIADKHSGFGTTEPFLAAALNRPDGVGYSKHQDYTCDSNIVGSATIDRRFSNANGIEVRKTGPS